MLEVGVKLLPVEVKWMLQVAPCGELASPLAVAGERLSPLSGPVVLPPFWLQLEMADSAPDGEDVGDAVMVAAVVTVSTGPGLDVGVVEPDSPIVVPPTLWWFSVCLRSDRASQ